MAHRPRYYFLRDKKVVPVDGDDVLVWSKMFNEKDRRVALTDVGPFCVSTVFMGLDHRFLGKGPPLVFETMTFDTANPETSTLIGKLVSDPEVDGGFDRYSTWEEAIAGHARIVAAMEEKLKLVMALSSISSEGEGRPS